MSSRGTILVVDDEDAIRFGTGQFLESRGFTVEEAARGDEALAKLRGRGADAILLDHLLLDCTALDLLPRLKAIDGEVPIVVLTAHGSIDLAVRAIKLGAEQFLTKPIEMPILATVLERALDNRRSRRHQRAGRSLHARETYDPFIGGSAANRRLAEQAHRIVDSDCVVLITGETGTGKTVLARWLHDHGPRSEEPWVDLNCAGLSRELLESELFGHERGAFTGAVAAKPGLLELANRGTVFLDEIGDVDPQVQPKLLTVLDEKRFRSLGGLQDRRVDIRLIAATHQDLAALVRGRRFRGDLYYRVSAVPLEVPPLRERVEDLPLLARVLLERIAVGLQRPTVQLSDDAVRRLQAYAWPGNIRELGNVLERAVLLARDTTLGSADLRFDGPTGDGEAPGSTLTLEQVERLHIERVLEQVGGRVPEAAARLGVPRSSLYHKLRRYGLGKSRI